MLKRITLSDNPPVTVERAKKRLRIDTDDFDEDLSDLILAATAAVEEQAHITVRRSSWEYRLDWWPAGFGFARFDGQAILGATGYVRFDGQTRLGWPTMQIPACPVRNVTAVKYLDANDVEQTIDPVNYSWQRTPEGADITFNRAFTFPILSLLPQPVRVSFDAGYDDNLEASGSGDDAELILPPQVEMAVLFLVGHWHEHPLPVVADVRAAPFEIPTTFDYLVNQLKVYR